MLCLGVRHARTADIARMARTAGYRCVWIDLEHSAMPVDCAAQIAATATDLGLAAWVRIPERDLGVIGRLLDGGATGIIAPRVESAEEARAVAATCRFAPRGHRSQVALLPQFGFRRLPPSELARLSDERAVVQILLETPAGIDAADAIAAVDGVDIIGIGMNDLTAELGCPGDLADARVRDACDRVAAAARTHGKLAIVGGVADPAAFLSLVDAGFAPLVFAGIDTDVLAQGLQGRVADWQARFPTSAGV